MFGSLLKVVLSPVDITASTVKDIVDVVTVNEDKEFGENTGGAFGRLGGNLKETFKPNNSK